MPGFRRYNRNMHNTKTPFTKAQRAYINKTANNKIAKKVKRKQTDIMIANTGIGATVGLVVAINGVVQGTDNGQRIGDGIQTLLIDFYWEWIVADSTNMCRITIIIWKELDDVAPLIGDIFQDTSNVRPFSAFDFTNEGERFRVVLDRMYSLQTGNISNRHGRIRLFPKSLPRLTSFPTDILAEGINKVYLILWSDSGSTAHPSFKMHGKMEYIDA